MPPHDQAGHQLALPLPATASLLDAPFTPAVARAAGVDRAALDRMLRDGRVVRVLRGVYVGAHVPLDPVVRARSAGRALPAGAVVVDRTAAWVHGLPLPVEPVAAPLAGPADPVPLDALGRGRRRGNFGGGRSLVARDVVELGGVRVTTPLRTCLDLGRLYAPHRALAVLDAALRSGLCGRRALLAELPRFARQRGALRLRQAVAVADERAATTAESVLRFHWLGAALPTPVPGHAVAGVRLSLGVPEERFGAVVGSPDSRALSGAVRLGWRVVVLSERRVLLSDAALVVGHLEREFHRHLLRQLEEG